MHCVHRLQIVPGQTHLFEEPGALERVGTMAGEWFLAQPARTEAGRIPCVVEWAGPGGEVYV